MKKTIEDFRGVIPAVLSVFNEQEDLDDQGTRELIRFLMSFPIGGLYLTGSTGETFLLGMYVGYKGKWLDAIILKISDVFLAFPQMVLIIIMVALVGQSLQNMIIIFILTGWPSMYHEFSIYA